MTRGAAGTDGGHEPIRGDEKVADVLARDEALIEVFESVSPAFSRLRRPGLRKVMTRLVTVEQAARVAGVDASMLVARLNEGPGSRSAAPQVAGGPGTRGEAENEPTAAGAGAGGEGGDMEEQTTERPARLAAVPAEKVVELDVREDLREGREPFSRIMKAKGEVPEGGALMLRAIFEPAPLYGVLGKQGFEHWTEHRGPEDWVIWFWKPEDGATDDVAPATVPSTELSQDGVTVLDVRGLEPPEPMVRTLAALESLEPGHTLVQINVREPRFLLPQLEERGFEYEVREQAEDLVRVFIRHAGD